MAFRRRDRDSHPPYSMTIRIFAGSLPRVSASRCFSKRPFNSETVHGVPPSVSAFAISEVVERNLLQPLKHLLQDSDEVVFECRGQLLLVDERLHDLAMLCPQRVHASLYGWIRQVVEERPRPLVVHSVEVAVDRSKDLGCGGARGAGFGNRSELAMWTHRVRIQVGLRETEAGLQA